MKLVCIKSIYHTPHIQFNNHMPHLSPKTHIPACLQIDKGATSIMINKKNIAIYKLENPIHGLSRDIIVIRIEITLIL
jgi:hypothetical protein